MAKYKLAAGLCVVLFVAAGLAFFLWMTAFLSAPAGRSNSVPRVFTIEPGQGLSAIAQNLARDGLITDPFRFKLYARYKQAATRLKAGEYQLTSALTPVDILDKFLTGKVLLYRLTIPEGLNMDEISRLVEAAGICPGQTFLDLCQDREFIRELGLSGTTLEGYLFPDTYLYPRATTCRQLVQTMTDGFKRVFTDRWKAQARTLGFSLLDIVTLASMIEKEAADPRERPLISSVFHNRLKKGIRLESDPTVIYGQDDYDGRIRYRHLRRVTPYNTYQISGLPVGPIANPGAKSLEAALYPADTDLLFFVSRNDKTHEFSRTLEDHNRAVQKYQLNR